MSEYQYFEFAAIDRPLTDGEMAALRAVSTRAAITPSGFVNHYEWGWAEGRSVGLDAALLRRIRLLGRLGL